MLVPTSSIADTAITGVRGEIVGGEIHAHNTFDKPDEVGISEFTDFDVKAGEIEFKIPAASVLHLEVITD